MGKREEYIEMFFQEFLLPEDQRNQHFYTLYMKESILEFLEVETKANAMTVYETFFDCYKLKLNDKLNFVDLLDVLKKFEENASTLIDKQRDHFVHSVNVFILGLSIYATNPKLQRAYADMNSSGESTKNGYMTVLESFFFEWGLASLCHDIGYPIEITNKQFKKFIDIVTRVSTNSMGAKPFLDFQHFEVINSFTQGFLDRSNEDDKHFIGNQRPLDLLARDISRIFDIEYDKINNALNEFFGVMKKGGFVDHGFYSAIIVLKWYANYIEMTNTNYEVFYKSVLSSATAILLHNYYKNVLMKPPFNLELLNANRHPLSYLLILCDELQDWNREAYGVEDKKRASAEQSRIDLSEQGIKLTYLTFEGELASEFVLKKKEAVEKVLDLADVYEKGIDINVMTKTDLLIEEVCLQDAVHPRLLIENIEKLARMIHDDYNNKQRLRNPNQVIQYPAWEALPQTLKYSNVRQARAITEKLKKLGYIATEYKENSKEIKVFRDAEVEYLAKIEHNSWMEERVQNGWKYGVEKDVEKKISPYIVPYEALSEEIKELDRDAVKNVIPLLNKIGLRVYKTLS